MRKFNTKEHMVDSHIAHIMSGLVKDARYDARTLNTLARIAIKQSNDAVQYNDLSMQIPGHGWCEA